MSNITSPLAVAVAGGILSYRITANNSPVFFGATNLPGGLALYKGGILAGQILPGTYQIGVTATNATGDTASATLTLTVADDRTGPTPPIFADAAFRVQQINADGTPANGGSQGCGNAPNAPAQTATSSGGNLTETPVVVGAAAPGAMVSPASSVARIVSLSLPTTATDGVQLSFASPAAIGTGVFTLLPGGLYETPVPVTQPIFAIALSGTQTVTRVEYL